MFNHILIVRESRFTTIPVLEFTTFVFKFCQHTFYSRNGDVASLIGRDFAFTLDTVTFVDIIVNVFVKR